MYFKSGVLLVVLAVSVCSPALAGPYAPGAGKTGSLAVSMDDPSFVAWATGWKDLVYGANVVGTWKTPEKALGPAVGTSYDILCLGEKGRVTLTFALPIKNGAGWDFAVFENAFSDTFLELAYVEVSSNGKDFIRFPCASLTPGPVSGAGALDPTNIDGLGGKYRQGFGTPFDLQDLATDSLVLRGKVDLSRIAYVRILDISGNGSCKDSAGRPIYDPYPCTGSAGFDMDAIGARYVNTAEASEENHAPETPVMVYPLDGAWGVEPGPVLQTAAFADPDWGDAHLLTWWQVATGPDFSSQAMVFEALSATHFTSLAVPGLVLLPGATYYWRARFYDGAALASGWSEPWSFTVGPAQDDADGNGVPDAQEAAWDWDQDGVLDPDVLTIRARNASGQVVLLGLAKGENVAEITAARALDLSLADPAGAPDNLATGLVAFRAVLKEPGLPATVYVRFLEAAPVDAVWYKYDTVLGWRPYEGAEFWADHKGVTLYLEDGATAWGDADGALNGVIVDPGGASFPEETPVPDSGAAGFGGGGCFIKALR